MTLINKLIKNSTIKTSSILNESIFFEKKDMIQTEIPMLNVALSGQIDGGLTPGLLMIAGPSKHFKSGFSLLLASAYLKKYSDGVILFYDSEFGTPQSYFKKFNIDPERVVHTPITDVEQLKHDIIKQLDAIERGDKVIIILDSLGNLASKKEVDDAMDGKSVADMSRAKQNKSLFRMITPYLTLKDIPMIVINHTYKEIGLYPKDIVGGGTGSYYSSNDIWILGRQQEKDEDGIAGYHFIINIEKSRYVKEKSKIPISVMYDGFINKYSGLFDVALESGHIREVSKGWYTLDGTDLKQRKSQLLENAEMWNTLLEDKTFQAYIKNTYSLV